MGFLVQQFTTSDGFVIRNLHVKLTNVRLLKSPDGTQYSCAYSCTAYKTDSSLNPIGNGILLPRHLATSEMYLKTTQFFEKHIFGYAYDALKQNWQSAGYVLTDSYSGPNPTEYIYDLNGKDILGFNSQGFDTDGYDRNGYNAQGWNRNGFGRDGFNAQGWDKDGFNQSGVNAQGFNRQGFNSSGYDKDGYDRDGYDSEGYNKYGFNKDGYDKDGYNQAGYNSSGLDRDGNPRPPQPPMILSTNQISTMMSSYTLTQQISTLIGISTSLHLQSGSS